MLQNFITSTDLYLYEPNLSELISGWSGSPINQIGLAFKKILGDLRADGKDTRLMMLPLWLSSSTYPNTDHITSGVSSVRIEQQRINRVGRFVIEKTACTLTGENTIALEGSNDGINFDTVTSLSLTTGAGTINATFSIEYTYYRYAVTVGGTLDMTAEIYLVETSFDELICLCSLYYIFSALSKSQGDAAWNKCNQRYQDYVNELRQMRYSYDVNEDGSLNEAEEKNLNYRIAL
jgi:hypothetical protein